MELLGIIDRNDIACFSYEYHINVNSVCSNIFPMDRPTGRKLTG